MVIALFGASAATGSGQTLDIGPAETPAGAGAAVAHARADLLEDLGELNLELESASPAPLAAARAAVRRYALTMLPEPGDPAPAPSIPLLGRTLWRLTPALDEAIGAASAGDRAHLVLFLDRAPPPLDAGQAELTLRDALAPLAEQASGPLGGWFDRIIDARPGAELAGPLDDAAYQELAEAGADDATLEQIRALALLLGEADQWRAYQRSAAAIRSRLRLASAAFAAQHPWVDDITRAALADAWAGAARRLADEREDAALQLELLDGVMRSRRLLETADALEGPRWDRARAGAQAAVGHDPTMRSQHLRDGAAMLQRVVRLVGGAGAPGEPGEPNPGGAADGGAAPTERSVVRQLRPAWRALARQRDQAVEDLAAVAPDLLGGGRAITDPGALAALAALEQAAGDLEGLLLISAAIADPETPEGREPRAHRDHRLTAARLLSHGQALQSGEGAEAALAELRQFAAILRAREGAPSAAWVAQQPAPVQQAWRRIAGGRAMELLEADADVLRTWLRIWPDTTDATRLRELQQRLRAHELLLAPLEDLAEVSAMAAGGSEPGDPAVAMRHASAGRAAVWPGWELSAVALDALLARAEARLAEAVAMALDRRGPAPANRARAVGEDLAPLRLVVALERSLREVEAPAPGGSLDEVALGPALPGSHLGAQRMGLAAAALALEDWALSPEADEALWAHAVDSAAAALRELGG